MKYLHLPVLLLASSLSTTPLAAALPQFPQGDNSENVVFWDDFTSNRNGWSAIGPNIAQATIGSDPGGVGSGVWYPSLVQPSQVGSSLTMSHSLDLAEAPITVYARARVSGGNLGQSDSFRFGLAGPTTAYPAYSVASLLIRPGAQSLLFHDRGNSIAYWLPYYFQNATTLVDFRLRLTSNGDGTMTVNGAYYNPATLSYVSLGTVANAPAGSGLFKVISLGAYRQSASACPYVESVMVTQDGSPRAIRPANAYVLPVSQRANLQAALDAYKVVVLEKGDYYNGNQQPITLRSGYRLYGDPAGCVAKYPGGINTYWSNSSAIPPVTVEPGSTGIVLSTVTLASSRQLTFPTSSLVTKGNVFQRLVAYPVINGATMEDNLFLGMTGSINVNTSGGGYLRNNRFIRCQPVGGTPLLKLQGDAARQSFGNVFLDLQLSGNKEDTTYFDGQGDLTLAGVSVEMNSASKPLNSTIKTGAMGTLRLFGLAGGANSTMDPAYLRGSYDIAADELQLYSDRMYEGYKLRSSNARSLILYPHWAKPLTDEASDAFRLMAFQGGGTATNVNGTSYTSPVPVAQQQTLRSMLVNTARSGAPWEAPAYDAVPDPAGPNWNQDLANQPDSTAYIQGLIDANGIARLPQGIYYISAPLRLTTGQGIIGDGADTTAIIAKDNTIDMIVEASPAAVQKTKSITLADITFQGGKNGIHGFYTSSGGDFFYNGGYFHHVTFRDMATAGIFMDQIRAFDNNLFSYVHFVNCGTGFKQYPDPAYTGGETSTMAYMDKCTFYKCQFINNGIALDLLSRRASNNNAWINCLFQGNGGGAAKMIWHTMPLFANCDFENNGGTAIYNSDWHAALVLNCRFSTTGAGAMLAGPISADGCSFQRLGASTATILEASSRIFLNNCVSTNMPLNLATTTTGMFINNALPLDTVLNQQVVTVIDGIAYTLVPGMPDPKPQILFGSDWFQTASPALNY